MQKNHLSGLQQELLKVVFWNSQHLMEVRREMQPIIRRNKNKANATDAYKAFGPQKISNSVKLQARDPDRTTNVYFQAAYSAVVSLCNQVAVNCILFLIPSVASACS